MLNINDRGTLEALEEKGTVDVEFGISLSSLIYIGNRLSVNLSDIYVSSGPNETLTIQVPLP